MWKDRNTQDNSQVFISFGFIQYFNHAAKSHPFLVEIIVSVQSTLLNLSVSVCYFHLEKRRFFSPISVYFLVFIFC